MADHGDGMASHRMVTKHISFYDEMTNVPFIFAGPGIKQQKKARRPRADTADTETSCPPFATWQASPVPAEKAGHQPCTDSKGRETERKATLTLSPNGTANMSSVTTPGRMVRGPRYTSTPIIWKATEKSCTI